MQVTRQSNHLDREIRQVFLERRHIAAGDKRRPGAAQHHYARLRVMLRTLANRTKFNNGCGVKRIHHPRTIEGDGCDAVSDGI